MLKGISKIISPELLKILCEMGHGDEIAIVDANYPAESMGKRVIRFPGIGICELLRAIMELLPVDHITENPINVLGLEEKDIKRGMKRPEIWNEFYSIVNDSTKFNIKLGEYSRQEFYEKSKDAFAIVQTGEETLYADLIIKKGVIE